MYVEENRQRRSQDHRCLERQPGASLQTLGACACVWEGEGEQRKDGQKHTWTGVESGTAGLATALRRCSHITEGRNENALRSSLARARPIKRQEDARYSSRRVATSYERSEQRRVRGEGKQDEGESERDGEAGEGRRVK